MRNEQVRSLIGEHRCFRFGLDSSERKRRRTVRGGGDERKEKQEVERSNTFLFVRESRGGRNNQSGFEERRGSSSEGGIGTDMLPPISLVDELLQAGRESRVVRISGGG